MIRTADGRYALRRHHYRHAPAGLSAAAACRGAVLHGRIFAQLFARLGAALTDLGADAAGARVEIRAAQHKVRARLADLGAVEQQPDVRGLGVLAALLQAVGNGSHADAVAVQALLNALL